MIEAEIKSDADRLYVYECELCNILESVRQTTVAKGKNSDLKKRCINALREADRIMRKLQKAVRKNGENE